MRKWLALVACALVALVAVHQPPRTARAQSGGTTLYNMGQLWNAVAPSVSASLFATNLRSYATPSGGINPQQVATTMTIGVSLKVASILYVLETDGTTTQVTALNGGVALVAQQDYTFTRSIRSMSSAATPVVLTYNFQLGNTSSSNGGLYYLRVQEVVGGVD